MKITPTAIPDVLIIEPRIFEDDRGYFFESYKYTALQEVGVELDFIQDNESYSKRGVVRGLHYQLPPFAQDKLIRVISGKVLDVAVDIREGSPTYGKYVTCELSAENKKQFLVPAGFAHGFSVLSESAIFYYKCSNYYHKESEAAINPLCSKLNIDWGLAKDETIISEKDTLAPGFGEHQKYILS